MDTTRTIARTAAHFFSGTFLSRLSGLVRDMAMAFAFGTHPSTAAFLTAFRLAHLFRRLLGEGAMQTAFIPQFEKLKAEDPERALKFYLDLKKTLILILLGLISFGMCALWLFSGQSEILHLTKLMLPSLFFIALFGLNASFLQCHQHYFTPSVAPSLFNFIWIGSIFFLLQMPVERAMEWLSGGIILASFAQWLLTERKAATLFTPPKTKSSDLHHLIRPLLLGFVGVASTQINAVLDSLFARFADLEGPAYLWYAIRIQQLPLALFGIALSSALLPPLTRAVKEIPKFCAFLRFALEWSIALMLPLTIALFLLGDYCVHLLFERGEFTFASTLATTKCLWAYAAGLVPMTLILIFAPALYAFNDYSSPSRASLIAMGMNCTFNFLLIFLGYGAVSVAIATSISAWWQMFYLYFCLKRHVKEIEIPQIMPIIFYSFCGFILYYAVVQYYPHPMPWSIGMGQMPGYPDRSLMAWLQFILLGLTFSLPALIPLASSENLKIK